MSEQMYEEEDGFPPTSGRDGMSARDYEFHVRMQARLAEHREICQAIQRLQASHPTPSPGSQQFHPPRMGVQSSQFHTQHPATHTQHPATFNSSQYYAPTRIIPQHSNSAPPNPVSDASKRTSAPPYLSCHSSSPIISPVQMGVGNQTRVSSMPYSVNNSLRSRRAAANPPTEQLVSPRSNNSHFTCDLPANVEQFCLPDSDISNITVKPTHPAPAPAPIVRPGGNAEEGSFESSQTVNIDWEAIMNSQIEMANKAAKSEDVRQLNELFPGYTNWMDYMRRPDQ
jgi:hypothetical protein